MQLEPVLHPRRGAKHEAAAMGRASGLRLCSRTCPRGQCHNRATSRRINRCRACITCTEKVRDAVAKLQSMENPDAILRLCAEIDRLETDADQVMHAAMAKLFREEPDAKQIIKLKDVYQMLESVTDKCEDVANLI